MFLCTAVTSSFIAEGEVILHARSRTVVLYGLYFQKFLQGFSLYLIFGWFARIYDPIDPVTFLIENIHSLYMLKKDHLHGRKSP